MSKEIATVRDVIAHGPVPRLDFGETIDMSERAIKVRLKWFNVQKGFGFVVPEDKSFDAFLHITTLQRAGVKSLGEGAYLLCHIERGKKGAQITEIVKLLDEGTQPETIQGESSDRGKRCDGALSQLRGVVKWYKPDKGFGFVIADDGLKEVFLHKDCLQRHGLETIDPGTSIIMTVRATPKGREVVDFEFR